MGPFFTPGPWAVSPKVANTIVKLAAKPTSTVEIRERAVFGGRIIAESIERKADLDLIAAAPEMYYALRAAMEIVPANSRAYKVISEAVAKAEGREHLGPSKSFVNPYAP